MKKMLCAALIMCLCCPYMHSAVLAEESAAEEYTVADSYPDADSIPDNMYRTLMGKNDVDSQSEIGGYIHNGEISMGDGIVSYTPNNDDNGLFFNPTPAIIAGDTEKIELRMRIPVAVKTLKLYFVNELGLSEDRILVVEDIKPSEEFQTITINTAISPAWSGTVTQYRISIMGAPGETFDIDSVYFYSGYNAAYTEDDKCRLYDFDSKDYGFEGNQYASDIIPYDSELWARIAGADAAFTTAEGFEMEAEQIPRIRISYNNMTPGTVGKLYFTTETEKTYNDECSYTLDIAEGQQEYSIDTADNERWNGKITGLRFVPSDAEGVVRIGSVRIEKFPCTVSVRDGIISGSGNLYGSAGRMSVRAQNPETGTTDYSQNIRSGADGSFEFSFEIADAPDAPTVYDILFKGTEFSGTFKKKVVYASTEYIAKTLEKINAARTDGDADALKELIESNYKPINFCSEHYETLTALGQGMDEFYASLIGETAETLSVLEEQMDECAAALIVKYMPAKDWISAIDKYDEYLHLKELEAYKTYASLTDTVKEEIAEKMSAERCADFDAARDAFGKNVVLIALSHAVEWGDVKDILQDNAELLEIDFKAVNALKSPSEAYRQLTEKSFASCDAVREAFNNAVSVQAEKENKKPAGGGGGSGSSGSGGSGFYMPPSTVDKKTEVTPSPAPNGSEESFNDLSGFDWAKKDIAELYGKGIVSGTGNGGFEPNRTVTREEFVKMLVSAFELPLSTDLEFADVEKGTWYAGYIGAAVKAGIAYGQGDVFGVGQPMSRQDVAVMAARALGMEGAAEENGFTDYDEIADYAKTAVSALAQANILNGYDGGMFCPQKALTRAEAAVIINRVIGSR